MAHRIFVYGTLKRGFANHALLHNATFLGEARTRTAYPMVVHGTGFSVVIIPEPGIGHRVVGEVWEVDDAQLAQLDKLESTHLPTGYRREPIEVEMGPEAAVAIAFVYFKPRDRVGVIHTEPHADYQDRRWVPFAQRKG